MRITEEQMLEIERNKGEADAYRRVGFWLSSKCPKTVDADCNYHIRIHSDDIYELCHCRMPEYSRSKANDHRQNNRRS